MDILSVSFGNILRQIQLKFPNWLPLARVAAEVPRHLFHRTLSNNTKTTAASIVAFLVLEAWTRTASLMRFTREWNTEIRFQICI